MGTFKGNPENLHECNKHWYRPPWSVLLWLILRGLYKQIWHGHISLNRNIAHF